MAFVSLIFGIMSSLFCFFPFVNGISLFCLSPISIATGIGSIISKNAKYKKIAVAGLIIGIISNIVALVMFFYVISILE